MRQRRTVRLLEEREQQLASLAAQKARDDRQFNRLCDDYDSLVRRVCDESAMVARLAEEREALALAIQQHKQRVQGPACPPASYSLHHAEYLHGANHELWTVVDGQG